MNINTAVGFNFEQFVALRYLWGARGRAEGRSFLRFVVYVAMGGVAVGVSALLLSLAIVRGFQKEITQKIVGFGAHVQVRNYLQDQPISGGPALRNRLESIEGVADVAPRVERTVLLRRSERSIDGVVMVGSEQPPPYLSSQMVEGTLPSSLSQSPPSLAVGAELAQRLGIEVGDTVATFSLRSPVSTDRPAGIGQPRVAEFVVRGVFETSLTTIDDTYVFARMSAARQLTGMGRDEVTRFDITTTDPSRIDSVAADIRRQLEAPLSVRTIYQIPPFSSLFAWVNLQQNIIPLVIGVIVVVAAFNIVGTLLMMILEKTREIGVLRSLGASQTGLKRLFLAIGLLIGGVGAGLGSALALVLSLLQQRFALIPLPADAYYMTTAPISLHPIDYLVVNTLALLLCALAAYVPARVAARIEPVRAIRFR